MPPKRLPAGIAEYLRPWKLATLAFGFALLVVGAELRLAPDWDIPISVIMPLLTYLTAPWSLRVLLERRWHWLPLALFWTWLTVDGAYALYWRWQNPVTLGELRSANFFVSLSLYGFCGVLWLYRGSLREFWRDLRAALAGRRR